MNNANHCNDLQFKCGHLYCKSTERESVVMAKQMMMLGLANITQFRSPEPLAIRVHWFARSDQLFRAPLQPMTMALGECAE